MTRHDVLLARITRAAIVQTKASSKTFRLPRWKPHLITSLLY